MSSKKIPYKKVIRIEELSLNSWPALRSLQYDGWILRLANGFTDRCNSVWPTYESSLKLEDKIDKCESFYAAHGQPPIFRITSDGSRSPLDDQLEKSDYTVKTPTVVQKLDISKLSLNSGSGEVSICIDPDEDWVDDVVDIVGLSSSRTTYQKILQNIILPIGLARIESNATVIALGLGVVEDKFLGLYGMHTRSAYRRQGWAKKLLLALLHWGQSKGAEFAYLHVEADNTPARTLYNNIGFNEIYRYWYRVKPVG